MQELRQTLQDKEFCWTESQFFDAFIQSDGTFLNQETELYDFKREWPFSYSDSYFLGLAKLISAFANSSGGLVIFGVDDETRQAISTKVSVNVDRLEQALSNILSEKPRISHRRYISIEHGKIDVLIVHPIPAGSMAIKFTRDLENIKQNSFFVRVGHETRLATAKHIPLLFCRSGLDLNDDQFQSVESSLPPSPSNIQQFVGRMHAISCIFNWLYNSEQPRQFLWGPGGSGKTTIAYEVAKHVREFGKNVLLSGQAPVEQVIFLSAKEKALDVVGARTVDHVARDFKSATELYRAILTLGDWSDPTYLEKLDKDALLEELKNYLDMMPSFIIIDDIDTLTTKGIDAGLEDLYLVSARAKLPSKFLYTLRNVPSNALANAIEVPGLQMDGDYETFIKICAEQFNVKPPDAEFQKGRLQAISDRRPLVIESIIAMRRRCDSYQRAAELFEQHGGDSIREYVFKREWDALPANNRSRYLLSALAILDQPATLNDLEIILKYDLEMLTDAISLVREMFLETKEVGKETAFDLGILTKTFVLAQTKNLDRFAVIKERVKSLKRPFHPKKPELSRLMSKINNRVSRARHTRDESSLNLAWAELTATELDASIGQDPRYLAFKGYIATQMLPNKVIEAREGFLDAWKMGLEPEVDHLLAWYTTEQHSGHGNDYCEQIVDFVIKGRTYSRNDKLDFEAREAARLYVLGKELRYDVPEKSIEMLAKALQIHLRIFKTGISISYPRLLKSEGYARSTALLLFMLLSQSEAYEDIINICMEAAKTNQVLLDPLETPLIEYTKPLFHTTLQSGLRNRLRNRFGQLRTTLLNSSENWEKRTVPTELITHLEKIEDALSADRA